jgi:hypothetical protein
MPRREGHADPEERAHDATATVDGKYRILAGDGEEAEYSIIGKTHAR